MVREAGAVPAEISGRGVAYLAYPVVGRAPVRERARARQPVECYRPHGEVGGPHELPDAVGVGGAVRLVAGQAVRVLVRGLGMAVRAQPVVLGARAEVGVAEAD